VGHIGAVTAVGGGQLSLIPRIIVSALVVVLACAPETARGQNDGASPELAAEAPAIIFAAASLQASLTAAADAYAAHARQRPSLTFGASSLLAKQIDGGAPADLFISADEQSMDTLVAHGRVGFGSRVDFLANQLALVAVAARPFEMEMKPGLPLAELLDDSKLAMGDPDSVPVGRYGKEALTSLGVWQAVEPKLIRAADAHASLELVESGEARAGVVYSTDALASKKVVVVGLLPETSHRPIIYPLAIVAGHDRPEARAVRDFLLSSEAKAIFGRFGFIPK